jgi:hypothetical protein
VSIPPSPDSHQLLAGQFRRPAHGATLAGMTPDARPTLDGIEDKWMLRWDKERVVQV